MPKVPISHTDFKYFSSRHWTSLPRWKLVTSRDLLCVVCKKKFGCSLSSVSLKEKYVCRLLPKLQMSPNYSIQQ